MGVLQRSYEGAKTGRRTDGWITAGSDANAEIMTASTRLRDRARDLVRNNAYAAKAVSALASNLVGSGIIPRARADDDALAKQTDALWERFTHTCDADGLTDFHGLQSLVTSTMVESGECLVRIKHQPVQNQEKIGTNSVPLTLQVLEPDHLDSSRDRDLPTGSFIQQGIEFDASGQRVAYWLFPRHPGAAGSLSSAVAQSVRVPAEQVLHIFDRLRPGQIRGVTWFAPAILKLRDLDEYDEAELVRKKIEACFVAFVLNADDAETLGDARDASGRRIESFEPGMVEYLPAGKDVRFGQPSSTAGYSEYMRVQLHAVAAAVGLTYELLTGDLSQVNYSSIRAGLLEFRRRIDALQRQILIPMLCRPVWQRFVATAQASGLLGNGEISAEWTPPRFEAVDPMKDVQAEMLAVRAGFMPLKEAIARQGYYPNRVLQEISDTFAELDSFGITLDTDARRSTRNGQAKPMMEKSSAQADD
ncbi:MAG: phage portal protein [Magnetococcales bacterium]|nr:phage portal protein [Magnetococcales bacterium]